MSKTKIKICLLFLFPLGLLLNYLYTLAPETWARYYSMGVNKWTIQALSLTANILPFSIFEFLIYGAVIGLIIYTIYTIFKIITNFSSTLKILLNFLLNIAATGAVIYIAFISLWGLNYKRPHFSERYDIVVGTYSHEELGDLYQHLLNLASRIRSQLPENEEGLMVPFGDHKDIFDRAQRGYDVASKEFPILGGKYGQAKPIMASELLNYTGITGIYSPFTGEPNVNIAVPMVTLPSTTCHEMAHQRGYGFENECNFIAFITCIIHPDLDFQYSGLIMAISYTSNALATADLALLQQINTSMDPKVFNDLSAINTFWDQYEGDVKEVSEQVNNAYLESNGVVAGTESYGEMVDLILALYDKYR